MENNNNWEEKTIDTEWQHKHVDDDDDAVNDLWHSLFTHF